MNYIPSKINLLHAAFALGIATTTLTLPLHAQETVKGKPDGSWVSLSGQVVSHTPSAFSLDYGQGFITVETDDWDNIGDGWAISEGDEVTVYGRIDDGFYQNKKIEAGSIFIEDLNTLVSAPSSADEEDMAPISYTYFSVPAVYNLQLAGTVTSVSGREFTIDAGKRKVTVDTMQMGYNPLDDVGIQKIDKGDFVSVSGELDINYLDKAEISAETIVSYN